MAKQSLQDIAKQMMAPQKGLLAADESERTAGKRLAAIGIENTEEMRRQYRSLFLCAPGVERYLSGVILHDETFFQSADSGDSFVQVLEAKGILPGIKVDKSTHDLPGFPEEVITHGIDGLGERLAAYAQDGAKFTKWRSVIRIVGDDLPTRTCLEANMHGMALYAAYAQAARLVPIVEPEVLYDGEHSLERCEEVLRQTLNNLFERLHEYKVDLTGTILKTSMVLPGKASGADASSSEVAEATMRVFGDCVPSELAGIVFLSGGQSAEQATINLNAIAQIDTASQSISFSYARALQELPLEKWHGQEENVAEARKVFFDRLEQTVAAREGRLE